ncbi:hypothetical protein Taro_024886 [Colocasia esculenta]|uniref:Uncharacterized protein n=1 Tax=Colocasia esculenta TaxID=4460 RepID=A0A843V1N1_COLES|nr:hypothetical protein [Colocasia esculenta]
MNLAAWMWTLRVAVAVGGIGVDANLRILQVLKDAWRIVERVAVTNRARKRRGVVQFPWEFAEAAVGPFVHDYEAERLFLCCVVRVGYWPDQPVVHSRVVASFPSDSCFATCREFMVYDSWSRFDSFELVLVLLPLLGLALHAGLPAEVSDNP